jgi:hypothetical protein
MKQFKETKWRVVYALLALAALVLAAGAPDTLAW